MLIAPNMINSTIFHDIDLRDFDYIDNFQNILLIHCTDGIMLAGSKAWDSKYIKYPSKTLRCQNDGDKLIKHWEVKHE